MLLLFLMNAVAKGQTDGDAADATALAVGGGGGGGAGAGASSAPPAATAAACGGVEGLALAVREHQSSLLLKERVTEVVAQSISQRFSPYYEYLEGVFMRE